MTEPARPTRKEILKPVELLVISLILGAFVGLVVLFSTRQPLLAAVFFGIAFIVSLVVTAMFTLTFKPNQAEVDELAGENEDGTPKTPPPYLGPGPKGH
ncbi:hypothetical protein [Subtercola lobariae]|uniref:Uncharacterized protein n=1 Tax=Subtercola lobariae TaxID=1588641 RepID=A0A917F222_9MICO|nr:hypothetical protein [Subtercola lobariae]GGF37104.1 hypothetical protein GCM10011399_32540 [Subtercola lobariae]